ncbi:nucleotide-diphospho-sugar transferase [Mycena rebaudengoi]|nr:nucleotide-diphospho-sugar transferase [Mycena rebaudengoi]
MERGIPIAPVDENELTMRPWYSRWGRRKLTNFAMRPEIVVVDADAPAVILPFPPTTEEKYIYAQTRRVPLYIFGTLSFLSVSVGMWFFSISSDMFVCFIRCWVTNSTRSRYTGRDYDLDNHRKVVAEFATVSCDILLPVCKEPLDILVNTWKYVAQLSYTNFKVHVLDDGGLDSVKVLAEKFGFNYIRPREPWVPEEGGKSASFVQPYLRRLLQPSSTPTSAPATTSSKKFLPLMRKEPDIAIVQTPQFFRPCDEQTWVEQGGSATQELFYRVIQVNRDHWGAAICVGSNAVYRREALKEVGGTAEIGHSEDVHTGFYALNRGWRLKYIPIPLACGISPDTAKAYFSQQMRWCSGSTTLLSNPEFWKSKLTIVQKLCFLTGMLFYTASAVLLLLNPLPALLMLAFQPGHILYYNFVFVIPALIDAFIIFRLWSRQRYNLNVNFVYVIQQYAYLMALKDKLFNTTAAWVPSGDTKAHEGAKVKGGNNKYRNSRILCAFWVYSTTAGAIVGSTFRILEGYAWYNYLPLMLLDSFTLVVTFRFIWSA